MVKLGSVCGYNRRLQSMINSSRRQIDNSNLALILLAVLIGLIARLAAMYADRLDVDIYYMMTEASQSFSDYTRDAGFSRTLMLYWWLIDHAVGESLWVHRVFPFFLNVLAIGLVAVWLYRFVETPEAVIFATLFFGLSSWATYTVEYPVINYSVEILLGVIIFKYTIACCCNDAGMSKSNYSITIICIVFLAAMASYTIVVPVCACLATNVIWHVRNLYPGDRDNYSSPFRIMRLWPMLFVVSVQGFLWSLIPYRYLGDKLPTHMYKYFMNRSDSPQNVVGAIQFTLSNTREWMRGLITPVGADELFAILPVSQKLFYGALILTVVCTLVFLAVRRRIETPIVIALIFVTLVALAILFGGLIGMFPYGSVRYTGWLLMPISLIFGSTASAWIGCIDKIANYTKVRLLISSIAVVSAALLLALFTKSTLNRRAENYAAVELLKDPSNFDEILYSGFIAPALRGLVEEATNKGIDLGFGKVHKSVEEKILDQQEFVRFQTDSLKDDRSLVAVCAQSKERLAELHPSWSSILSNHYRLSEEIDAPDLWVGFYKK
jgi:hypothetical protein